MNEIHQDASENKEGNYKRSIRFIMTLLACQIFSTIAHEGSFARTAEQLHLTPSAISHAVSTMETECGFPLFTRTKSGVTMTAAAENLLPAIQRLLASSESLAAAAGAAVPAGFPRY